MICAPAHEDRIEAGSADWLSSLRTLIAESVDEARMLSSVVSLIADGLDAASVRIWSANETDGCLTLRAMTGLCLPFDGLQERVPIAGSELGQVLTTGRPYTADCRSRGAPDEIRQWASRAGVAEFLAVPIGNRWGVLGLFSRAPLTDIQRDDIHEAAPLIGTAVTRLGRAADASETTDLLSSLVPCLNSAIVTLDQQGHVTRWSTAAEQLFGWTEADVLHRPLPIILPERRHEFATAHTDSHTVRSRTECQRADLTLVPVERTSAPLFDNRGDIVGRLEIFTDDSPRRQANRRLEVQSQLARLLTGCRTLEEALPVLLRVLGEWLNGDIVEFWRRDERQDGLVRAGVWASLPETQARLSAVAVRLKPDADDWAARADRQTDILYEPVVATGEALQVAMAGVAVPIRGDQQSFGVLTCRGVAIAALDEPVRQTLRFAADALAQFLQRLHTEAELARSESNLRQTQKMDAIGLLAGGVAHDFNNLLTIILAYSEMGLGDLEPDSPMRELFEEIHGAGERAAGMTRKLLAVSRQQPAQFAACRLNQVVTEMEKMLRRLVGAKITLTLELAPNLALLHADLNQLEQVLLNLVVNARDAMPDGGAIVVTTRNVERTAAETRRHDIAPGPFVELAVRDTGCGMDAATLARIFEPFFTTKGVGKGTGMGLSTVLGIVQQSGGYLDVTSTPNVGTTFLVSLPQMKQQAATQVIDAACETIPRGTETVLVVEADDALRGLCRRLLEIRGYTVHEAIDGGEAVKLLNARRPTIDLVLADLQTPIIDGVTLARQLLTKPQGPRVMLMSGHADPPGDLPLDPTCQFLRKPFTSLDLARQVRKTLDARRS